VAAPEKYSTATPSGHLHDTAGWHGEDRDRQSSYVGASRYRCLARGVQRAAATNTLHGAAVVTAAPVTVEAAPTPDRVHVQPPTIMRTSVARGGLLGSFLALLPVGASLFMSPSSCVCTVNPHEGWSGGKRICGDETVRG
jgi:hypothetical protein